MEYRELGATGLRVSALGFGASPLGDEFGPIDEAEGRRAVRAALEAGINYFDVSPYYGRTLAEQRLGAYLEGARHEVVLASKVGRYDKDPPDGFDFSAGRVRRSVDESLRRLRTDYLDVVQVHDIEFGDLRQIVEETLPALEQARAEGKARFIGITGYPLGALAWAARRARIDAVLSYGHYTLLNARLAEALAPLARARGFGLINASPLHMGLLTDRPPPARHPAPEPARRAAAEAADWSRRRGLDLAALALQFALACPVVAVTLVGMGSPAEVARNVAAAGAPPDAEALAEVQALLAPVQGVAWASGRPENHTLAEPLPEAPAW